MHTVQLLEQALAVARSLGYAIRQEWLESGGGVCEFNGRRWLFVDLSQTAADQLAQVGAALRDEPRALQLAPSPQLQQYLQRRRAAA